MNMMIFLSALRRKERKIRNRRLGVVSGDNHTTKEIGAGEVVADEITYQPSPV
jgi:hypothetical protein